MKKIFLTLNMIFMMVFSLSAQIVEKTFFFDNPQFEKRQVYEQINFDNCIQRGEVGNPSLPWHSISLLLPQNTEAKDIEIEYSNFIEVEGSHLLYPYQAPRPVSVTDEIPFEKNDAVYMSSETYPSDYKSKVNTQYLNGYSFAFSGFTPVRYVPATGKVSYAQSVTVRVKYVSSRLDKSKMLKTTPEIQSRVKRLAQNPETIGLYSDNSRQSKSDGYELLVVTPEEWVSHFDEYKAHYDSQGLRTKVVSLEDIYSSSDGRDEQEKIRTFIANEYENKGIMMVLLGGDSNVVPYRSLYCYVMEDYEDDLPADMYYVCLDGTWNDDNDERWGEIGEDDLLPELAIGRMPFNNEMQFNNMMHKTLEYQRNPVLGEFNDIILGAEHLGDGYYGSTDLELLIGEQHQDDYTTIGIPDDYNFHRVYANGATGWSGTIFRNKINEVGGGYVHHVGHANTDYVAGWYVNSTNDKSFEKLDGVTHNYDFFHSHGCICGDFTKTCMLERLVNISTGFVAATGNSRYGWYIPWGDGPARHLHREFVDSYYNDRQAYIGTAFVEMKIATAPFVTDMWGENGALRWNMYCINILGDVAVRPWLDEPFIPEIKYAPAILKDAISTEILIEKNGEAQDNFRCSLFSGDQLLAFALTDDDGEAKLEFAEPLNANGTMKLIITGPNALCQTYDVKVVESNTAYVYAEEVEIDDSEGNDNGRLDFGETINLNMNFFNVGTIKAENVSATLTSTSDFIELIDTNVNIGDINANSNKDINGAFSFKVKENVIDQEYIYFTVSCTDENDTWSQELVYRALAPVFEINELSYDDYLGDNNGSVNNGETIQIHVKGRNIGHSKSSDIVVEGSVSNQYATFEDNMITVEGLDMNEEFNVTLTLVIDENTPDGEQFVTNVKLISGMYQIENNLRFTVGTIKEDFETGDFSHLDWKFYNDLPWTITDAKSYTGNYCAESGHIDDDEISSMFIEIENTSDGEVSFYYKVSTAKNTDFLAFFIDDEMQERWSGEVDWQYASYEVPAGIHIFEWRYDKSPNHQDGEDRCWIDDIDFPANSIVLGVESISQKKNIDIYPNPANNYIIVEGDDIQAADIYNMMGVKVISSNIENSSVIGIENLSSGVYIIRLLDINNNVSTKRFIKK